MPVLVGELPPDRQAAAILHDHPETLDALLLPHGIGNDKNLAAVLLHFQDQVLADLYDQFVKQTKG
jgi:enhancing lycopene biosynthesis protein 2